MKKLFLIRHAKSSWKDKSLADWQRPLNKRGKKDAPKMGKRLAERGAKIDLIVSSPAKRAMSTAKKLAKELGYKKKIVQNENLYNATEWQMLEVIHSFDFQLERVMLVTHNPGLTDFVNQISGRRVENIPTCGIVELAFEVESWRDIGKVKPVDFTFDYPKNV